MPLDFSRRHFLRAAALAPLAAGALVAPRSALANEPVKRTGPFFAKPALNAYSFNSKLMGGVRKEAKGITLFDLLDFCAEHGLEGIDATGYYMPGYPDAPSDEYLYRFKRRAYELGIGIVGTGTRNYFISPDKALRADGVKAIKTWVDVAHKLGATVLRVFADDLTRKESWTKAVPNTSHDDVQAWVADDLRECAEYGQGRGVIIGVQNHGDFNGTADEFLALIKRVDSEWCAPILDTGYFNTPDPYVDIGKVAPYAVNWTVKQSVFDGGYGETPIDLARIMAIVRAANYRGYLPIETLGAKGSVYDPFTLVPAYLKRLREAIAASA